MIDINKLREKITTKGLDVVADTDILEILDRLEAAEKELAELRSSMKFRTSLIGRTEAERDALYAKISDLTINVEYLGNLKKSYEELIGELQDERDALRIKIEEMEKQEPVEWQTRTRPAWNDGTWGPWRRCSEEYAEDIKKTPLLHDWLYEARALYALPDAKGE